MGSSGSQNHEKPGTWAPPKTLKKTQKVRHGPHFDAKNGILFHGFLVPFLSPGPPWSTGLWASPGIVPDPTFSDLLKVFASETIDWKQVPCELEMCWFFPNCRAGDQCPFAHFPNTEEKARCRWEQSIYRLPPLPLTSLRPLLRPLNYLAFAVPPRRRRGETKCAAQLVSMPSCGLPKKTSQKGEKAPKKVR